jgi:hypothetical protein
MRQVVSLGGRPPSPIACMATKFAQAFTPLPLVPTDRHSELSVGTVESLNLTETYMAGGGNGSHTCESLLRTGWTGATNAAGGGRLQL